MRLLFIYSLLLLTLTTAAQKPATRKSSTDSGYSFAAQKEYLPEDLPGVYFGMSWSAFAQKMKPAETDAIEPGHYQGQWMLQRYWRAAGTIDWITSVRFYFHAGDSVSHQSEVPMSAVLFSMLLEFDSPEDAGRFIDKYKNKKLAYRKMTDTGFRIGIRSRDGLEWTIDYSHTSAEVRIRTRVKGVPED